MSPTALIVRKLVVSFVLLTVLQSSGAMRFSRPIFAAPSVRKYIYPWKYVPLAALPRSMQRRFMWKEMDDSVDGLMDGVASGTRTMTHMLSPPVTRYRKPVEYDTQSSSKVKYVLKKPPPFKRTKVVKYRGPSKAFPPMIYKGSTTVDFPPVFSTTKPNVVIPFISQEDLRKIEKEQEKRVESGTVAGIHEHSHMTHMDDDVVSGRINEFGEGWLPIKTPFSTSKPYVMSNLYTKMVLPSATPSQATPLTSSPLKNFNSYEVTEHSAEESIQQETSFQPSNHFDFLTSTTEMPNYPEHFLKTIQESQTFKPMRVRLTTTTTPAPTTSFPVTFPTAKPTLSNRLPPRSTTERPFKRYLLHRPKSSKLFFNRAPSSAATVERVHTTPTTEQNILLTLDPQPEFREPLKTTQTSIRTTRESPKTTTTSATTTTTTTTSKPSTEKTRTIKVTPEKVRNTRNNSEVRSKLRIKNITQNEGLKKVLNKHRGSVKFGEKQS